MSIPFRYNFQSSEGKVPWLVCQHGRISVVVNSGTLVGHLTQTPLDDITEEKKNSLRFLRSLRFSEIEFFMFHLILMLD